MSTTEPQVGGRHPVQGLRPLRLHRRLVQILPPRGRNPHTRRKSVPSVPSVASQVSAGRIESLGRIKASRPRQAYVCRFCQLGIDTSLTQGGRRDRSRSVMGDEGTIAASVRWPWLWLFALEEDALNQGRPDEFEPPIFRFQLATGQTREARTGHFRSIPCT